MKEVQAKITKRKDTMKATLLSKYETNFTGYVKGVKNENTGNELKLELSPLKSWLINIGLNTLVFDQKKKEITEISKNLKEYSAQLEGWQFECNPCRSEYAVQQNIKTGNRPSSHGMMRQVKLFDHCVIKKPYDGNGWIKEGMKAIDNETATWLKFKDNADISKYLAPVVRYGNKLVCSIMLKADGIQANTTTTMKEDEQIDEMIDTLNRVGINDLHNENIGYIWLDSAHTKRHFFAIDYGYWR